MVLYTVLYRGPGVFRRWRRLRKVKGDGVLEGNTHRFFILEDERRVEIPLSYSFEFSKERFFSIKERMEYEARQDIQIRPS